MVKDTSKDNIVFKQYKYDINIKQLENNKLKHPHQSWIKLLFSGKDFNVKLMNAIRRISVVNIPSYAFSSELINIDTNTTVAFNNDYMRLRLSQLPVMGIDTGLYFLEEKYWYQVNYADQKREKHPNEKNYETYVNVHNNTANIIPVTTNDMSVYIDNEQIKPYDEKYPHLLIKLRPGDRFKCYMKATIGIGDNNIIWGGSRNTFYDEIIDKNGDKSYEFQIEGNLQCHEYEILLRTCKFLIKKLTDIKHDLENKIESKEILPEKIIHLKLEREDHSIGELLNYEFQDHKDILASGCSKPDHLVKAMLIKITSSPSVKSPLNAMLESIQSLIEKSHTVGYLITLL